MAIRLGIPTKRRQAAIDAAQATVGKTPPEWTAADMRVLLMIVLFQADALDDGLAIKPLNEWVRD